MVAAKGGVVSLAVFSVGEAVARGDRPPDVMPEKTSIEGRGEDPPCGHLLAAPA